MSGAAGFWGTARRLTQLHEDPAVVARWQAWTGPLLSRLTPRRRRALLALGALYVVVRRPLKEMAPAVDVRAPAGPLAAALIVLLCLVVVVAVYLAARRFASLPAIVRGRPQLWLHGGFWAIVVLGWLVPDGGGVVALTLSGLVLALAFLLWRMGYLLLSGQRGRMAGTRFSDHLLYLYPAYGGTGVPYGKGLDHLARHEATSEEALARSQLAGLKLLALAAIYHGLLALMAGLVYAEPRGDLERVRARGAARRGAPARGRRGAVGGGVERALRRAGVGRAEGGRAGPRDHRGAPALRLQRLPQHLQAAPRAVPGRVLEPLLLLLQGDAGGLLLLPDVRAPLPGAPGPAHARRDPRRRRVSATSTTTSCSTIPSC